MSRAECVISRTLTRNPDLHREQVEELFRQEVFSAPKESSVRAERGATSTRAYLPCQSPRDDRMRIATARNTRLNFTATAEEYPTPRVAT